MKKITDILWMNFALILVNWLYYYKTRDRLGYLQIAFIIITTLISLILANIMYARKFSLADHWAFAKKHPYLCNFSNILIFIFTLNHSKELLPNYNLWVFVLYNLCILFSIMMHDEVEKHIKIDFEVPD